MRPPPVLYVDIDDTLVRSFGSKRIPIAHMVRLVSALHASGAHLYCWSSGGADYARASAQALGLEACFQHFLPKPHGLLDDVTLNQWHLAQLHPNECQSLSAAELLARVAAVRA